MGALGIVETRNANIVRSNSNVQSEIDTLRRVGHYAIYRTLSGHEVSVDFYYNQTGYQPPAGDSGKVMFWSSSLYPDSPVRGAYYLRGDTGHITVALRSFVGIFAVRCMP